MEAYEKEIDWDEDEYEKLLNDYYGSVSICGMSHFEQGTMLREVDPTAFDTFMADHQPKKLIWVCSECDSEYEDEDEAEECCDDCYFKRSTK